MWSLLFFQRKVTEKIQHTTVIQSQATILKLLVLLVWIHTVVGIKNNEVP